ncbi:Peroxisome chaperone and import receptor [Arachnomyces sp. PD_36]|nr:Peroxisome chaperone and import receptor [Arachnomyces sp. PD_36]
MEKEKVAPSDDSPEQGAAAVASESVPPASEAAPPTSTTPVTESATTTAPVQRAAAVEDEDEESDWEDLDEVLDDFSAAKQDKTKDDVAPITGTSAAADAATDTPTSHQTQSRDTNTSETGIDEEAFLKQLEAGMAEMVGGGGSGGVSGGGGGGAPDEAAMADQWSALEKQLEASGMQPEDLLKQLMGDMLNLGGDGAGDAAGSTSSAPAPSSAAADQFSLGGGSKGGGGEEDFQSKIQKTMERMQDSGDRATSAAQDSSESGVGDELLAKMLKAMESGVGEGDEPDLMKVFMEMMEDLSHKEMLYEPMMELHTKFGPWLEANRGKVEAGEMERYENQAKIVGEIVGKFDEPGYSDQNADDKAYIWERMQKMQDAGNPPDELISNPVTDEVKNQLGADVPGCPQQ